MADLTEDEIKKLASAIIDEFWQRLQINMGKGLLDTIWRWIVTVGLAIALFLYAKTHSK